MTIFRIIEKDLKKKLEEPGAVGHIYIPSWGSKRSKFKLSMNKKLVRHPLPLNKQGWCGGVPVVPAMREATGKKGEVRPA
jgi:hypothetical protein